MALKQDLAHLAETLKVERDELRLRLHLLKAEGRDEWEQLEKQWQHFQQKAGSVGAVAGEAAGDVGAAARLLGEELRNGYRKIRGSL